MKNQFLSIVLLLFFAGSIAAQNRRINVGATSLDISYGPISVLAGDINIPINQNFNQINNKMYSIGIHQVFTKSLALKAAFDYGYYTAFENNNLLFYTNLFAFSVRGEYNLFTFGKTIDNSIYMFAGVGMTIISGENLNGNIAEPFNNTKPFSPIPFVTMGLGYKVKVTDRISLGLEGDLHYFISDLIDGYPKPNSYPHDMTSTVSINMKYMIFNKNFRTFKSNCNCE